MAITYKKISQLTPATSLAGTEPLELGIPGDLSATVNQIATFNRTPLVAGDIFGDYVVLGLLSTASVNLTAVLPAGIAYVTGQRTVLASTSYTYTASSDTYDDLAADGTVTHVAAANGAAAPAVTANTLRLQKVVTGATAVTSVLQLAMNTPPPRVPLFSLAAPLKVITGDAAIFAGTADRPHTYGLPNSVYNVLDKSGTGDSAGVMLRDNGNARAFIGLAADNNVHIQIASSTYPSETFTDRLLIRSTGEVDSLGTITRAYSATGVPMFACGNTNGSTTGAGLEIFYDQVNKFGGINAIDRSGNSYRPLTLSANGYAWYVGAATLGANPAASLSNSGIYTMYGGLQIASNGTYIGSFAQGMIYKSLSKGLVIAPITGSSYDLAITDAAGNNVLTLATGTKNLTTWASLTLAAGTATAGTAPLKFPSGVKLTTPEAGAIEYDGAFWITDSTGRQRLPFPVSPGGISTITVGASPFTYQNNTGGRVDILLQGATPGALQFSRDGATYYGVNAVIGTFIPLSVGDYIKVTYTTAPTMLLVPR